MKLFRGVERFFFEPTSTAPLAVVRIGVGFLMIWWTLALVPDATTFYGPHGVSPVARPGGPLAVFGWLPFSDLTVALVLGAMLAAAACFLVGWHTRLASVVLFVGVLSLQKQNPYVLNGGDIFLRLLLFSLVFAQCGASFSLDRRRRGLPMSVFPKAAPWALRLVQIQICLMYLDSVWEKVPGASWRNGTAMALALRLPELRRVPMPMILRGDGSLVNLFTYGTLLIELAIPILVWNRRTRPWVLGLGVALHLSIEATMNLGFFPLIVITSYVAFLTPAAAERLIGWTRRRWAERGRPMAGVASPPDEPSVDADVAEVAGGEAEPDAEAEAEPTREPVGSPVTASLRSRLVRAGGAATPDG